MRQSMAINYNQLQSMALACSICMLSSGASPCVASARTPACQNSPVVAAISGNRWQSLALSGNQWHSVAIQAIRGIQSACNEWRNPWHSVAISGNHLPELPGEAQSVAIRGNPWQSVAIRGNPWQSVAIRGNPWQSVAITCQSSPVRRSRACESPAPNEHTSTSGAALGTARPGAVPGAAWAAAKSLLT